MTAPNKWIVSLCHPVKDFHIRPMLIWSRWILTCFNERNHIHICSLVGFHIYKGSLTLFYSFLLQNRLPKHSASPSPRSSPMTGLTSGSRTPWRRAGATVWTWRPVSCDFELKSASSSMGTSLWSAHRQSQEELWALRLQTRWHRRRSPIPRTNRCHQRFSTTAAEDRGG